MTDNVIVVSENVAIVQYYDSIALESPRELYDTIELPVVQSRPIVEDQITDIKSLFGSWIESGDEDNQLAELYKSRLSPSS